MSIKFLIKERANPVLLRLLGVAPAPSSRFLMGQRMSLFSNFSIDCVLDVGANTGQYGAELRRLGYVGEIHSFEPMEAAFAVLQRVSSGDSRWHVHQVALGAESATAHLHTWAGSAGESSSLMTPTPALVELLGPPQEQMVNVVALDRWLEVNGKSSLANYWLKVDTQGFESAVLAGAGTALREVAGVEIELPLRTWYEGSSDLPSLMRVLDDAGLKPASIMTERFRQEWNGAIDVDALFVRAENMRFLD